MADTVLLNTNPVTAQVIANPPPRGYPARTDGTEPIDAYVTQRVPAKQWGGGLSPDYYPARKQKYYYGGGHFTYGESFDKQTTGKPVMLDLASNTNYSNLPISGYLGPFPERFDEYAWLKWRRAMVGDAGLSVREKAFQYNHDKRPSTLDQALEIGKGIAIVAASAAVGVGIGAAVSAAGGASAAGAGSAAASGTGTGGVATGATVAGGGTITAGATVPTAVSVSAGAGGIGAGTIGTVATAAGGTALAVGKKYLAETLDKALNPTPKPTLQPAVVSSSNPLLNSSAIVYAALAIIAALILTWKKD